MTGRGAAGEVALRELGTSVGKGLRHRLLALKFLLSTEQGQKAFGFLTAPHPTAWQEGGRKGEKKQVGKRG